MQLSVNNIDPIGNNTFLHTFDEKTDVEIGDVKSSSFEPRIKWRKWQNECNLSIGLMDYGGAFSQVSQDQVKWQKGDIEARFYRQDNAFDYPVGGYRKPRKALEFDIILKRKPATNRVPLSVRSKNVMLAYQPRLSLAEKWDYDLGAQKIIQAANVGGSIAVYHKSKMHGRYETGKVCHIYAPVMTDSAGRRAVGRLEIVDDNLIDIVMPIDFYNLASYPVLIDPTFGWDMQGGSSRSISNVICCNFWTIPENGAGNSIKAWVYKSGAGLVYAKCNIFKSTVQNDYLTNGATEQIQPANDVERTLNFTVTPYFEKNDDYGLAIWGSYQGGKSPTYSVLRYDVFDKDYYGAVNAYGANWPSFVWSSPDSYRLSIYCDYDAKPYGEVEIDFNERAPSIASNERAPSVLPTSRQPSTTITERAPGVAVAERAPSIVVTETEGG